MQRAERDFNENLFVGGLKEHSKADRVDQWHHEKKGVACWDVQLGFLFVFDI